MHLAEVIREEMLRQELTVTALASKSRMRRQTLSERLNGHSEFTIHDMRKIADSLGCSIVELMRRAEERSSALAATSDSEVA